MNQRTGSSALSSSAGRPSFCYGPSCRCLRGATHCAPIAPVPTLFQEVHIHSQFTQNFYFSSGGPNVEQGGASNSSATFSGNRCGGRSAFDGPSFSDSGRFGKREGAGESGKRVGSAGGDRHAAVAFHPAIGGTQSSDTGSLFSFEGVASQETTSSRYWPIFYPGFRPGEAVGKDGGQ